MSDVDWPVVTRYRNGDVLRDGELVPGDVWVREGKILDPMKLFYEERRTSDRVVDCRGLIVAPGFIDIQINGAFGVDFSSLEGDVCAAVRRVARGLLQHGVTSFCPTVVTAPPEYYHKVLPKMKCCTGGNDGASILGIHCEGPFISQRKKGAHQEAYIQDAISQQKLKACYGNLDDVRIITLAPELPEAMEAIRWLSEEHNIVVSLGHTMAKIGTAEKAVNNGASLITHLFNAMLPFHHRDPGLVGLLTSQRLKQKQIFYSLIPDDHHTHETVQRIAFKSNPNGVVLVTDAIAAMGLQDGCHSLGTMKVDVSSGAARLAGSRTLAGSVASMDSCVRNFKDHTGCSCAQALEAASLHAAQVLGIEHHKGTLSYGSDADLVILDQKLNVQATCIGGDIVWKAANSSNI